MRSVPIYATMPVQTVNSKLHSQARAALFISLGFMITKALEMAQVAVWKLIARFGWSSLIGLVSLSLLAAIVIVLLNWSCFALSRVFALAFFGKEIWFS